MSEKPYTVTPTSFLVHRPGARLFDERNIVVRVVEDESTGPVFTIESFSDDQSVLRLNPEGWEAVSEAVALATKSIESLQAEQREPPPPQIDPTMGETHETLAPNTDTLPETLYALYYGRPPRPE